MRTQNYLSKIPEIKSLGHCTHHTYQRGSQGRRDGGGQRRRSLKGRTRYESVGNKHVRKNTTRSQGTMDPAHRGACRPLRGPPRGSARGPPRPTARAARLPPLRPPFSMVPAAAPVARVASRGGWLRQQEEQEERQPHLPFPPSLPRASDVFGQSTRRSKLFGRVRSLFLRIDLHSCGKVTAMPSRHGRV